MEGTQQILADIISNTKINIQDFLNMMTTYHSLWIQLLGWLLVILCNL